MRSAFLDDVADRLDVPETDARRKETVLNSLRELLYVLSEASHCVRLSAFGDQHVAKLLGVQRKKVRIYCATISFCFVWDFSTVLLHTGGCRSPICRLR